MMYKGLYSYFTSKAMKNFVFCCIVFLLIYTDQSEASEPDTQEVSSQKVETVTIERVIEKPTPILRDLTEIDKSLAIPGSVRTVEPTEHEASWIHRFVTTAKNWLKIWSEISKMTSFQNEYLRLMERVYELAYKGNAEERILIRYRRDFGNGADPEFYAYEFIPYWICGSGFALGDVNLKAPSIYFQRSKKKLKASNGEMVFRKDRIFDIDIEYTIPWVDLRIEHEIVQWGEQLDPKENEGTMRFRLNGVTITMSLQLTEIDKRFVQKNPETGLVYYYRLPKLKDLSLSVKSINRFNNIIQQYFGNGMSNDRAEKILVDLTDLFTTKEGCEEICRRLKPVFVNKSAVAIMTAPDLLTIAQHFVLAWDRVNPQTLQSQWKDNDEIKLWHQGFYVGYNSTGLAAQALNFMLTQIQNIIAHLVKGQELKQTSFLNVGPAKEYKVGGLSVHDIGLDYLE